MTALFTNRRLCFARAVDHPDGDELSVADLVVPRPNVSYLDQGKESRLAHAAILERDVVIVERGQPLRDDRIALVGVGGESRLVRVPLTVLAGTLAVLPSPAEHAPSSVCPDSQRPLLDQRKPR